MVRRAHVDLVVLGEQIDIINICKLLVLKKVLNLLPLHSILINFFVRLRIDRLIVLLMRLKLKLILWVRIVIGFFQRQMRQIRVIRYLLEIVPEFLPFKCQHALILGVDRRHIWNVADWCLLIHTMIELL